MLRPARWTLDVWLLVLVWIGLTGCTTSRVPVDASQDPLDALLGPPQWPASATKDAPLLNPETLARQIHDEVNRVRMAHDLPPLAWKEQLAEVALGHSRDMADYAYFGHTNRRGETPRDRARQAGLPSEFRVGSYIVEGIGENLFLTHHFRAYHIIQQPGETQAFVFEWKTPEEIAREAVESWMQSPTHRANLLSTLYQAAAIGVVHNRSEALFITQNFSCHTDIALAGDQ